jgi:beta-barrel assembly-enhancing protease
MPRTVRWLGLGMFAVLLSGMDDPPVTRGKTQASKAARKVPRRDPEAPPPCLGSTRVAASPPARTMPELFDRMMQGMARDPARGFAGFLGELANLEGPALEGVTLTIAEERQAGLKTRADYLDRAAAQGFRVVNDQKRLDYLRALVARFSGRMSRRDRYPVVEVTLIDAPIPDGQSFPGGFVAFTTGLLDEPDEATVASVVAHELAHLDRGHLYGYARRSKLAEATYRNPPGGNASFDQFFTRQAALMGLMMNPFRPEHESEADCTSVTWLYQEGYDPRALVGFLERMHRRNNDQPANPFFEFGRTHPYSLDRRRDVLDRLAQLRRWKRRDDLGLFADNLRRLEPRAQD